MSRTCALIALELGMSKDECIELRTASAFHDLGKVGVPDSVLRKPGRLNAAERELIERHPQIGHEILAGSDDPTTQLAATIALTHHERVDGSGYPRGLVGDEIPLAGRIAAVADAFDALTHDRVYRPAFSIPDALEMIRDGRGKHYDPQILDAFEAALPQIEEVARLYPDAGVPDVAPDQEVPAAIRVLIVDDHVAVARGLEILLRREGIEVAGNVRDVASARRLLERREVTVALVDISLDGESGLDLLPAAKVAGTRVLVYTGLVDARTLADARSAGAHGVAAKAGPPSELIHAVKAVAAGGTYFDARFGAEPERQERQGDVRITRREHEIVVLLAEGRTGREIAERLFISPETVRTHVRNAMRRTGAKTRAHLITMTGAPAAES